MATRGDLGFIANSNRMSTPNRNFFGSPGHPSKKGIYGLSQTSKMNPADEARPTEISSDNILKERTEWLEQQERKLTATMNVTRSDTHDLKDALEESKRNEERQDKQIFALYNEMQVVYAQATEDLNGIPCANGSSAIEEYKKTKTADFVTVAKKGETVLLVYPMETVQPGDSHMQSLMKCKIVDETTGQLSQYWVVVFEQINNTQRRNVSKFSLVPKV